jgi:hypothetical protein
MQTPEPIQAARNAPPRITDIEWAYHTPTDTEQAASERLRYALTLSARPDLPHIIILGDEHGNGKIFDVLTLQRFFVMSDFLYMAGLGIKSVSAIPSSHAATIVRDVKRFAELTTLSYQELRLVVSAFVDEKDATSAGPQS